MRDDFGCARMNIDGALLRMDSAPIIYCLEGHPKFSPIFKPFFVDHDGGRVRFAVTTISLAEVLTGPLHAARLRASRRLSLAYAMQAANAISINAHALVTHDRDLSRVRTLRVLP
jgi:hypothetical protein